MLIKNSRVIHVKTVKKFVFYFEIKISSKKCIFLPLVQISYSQVLYRY